MTETLLYEVRRVRTKGEMDAALELRHEVFCEEQGVPKHEELDGRDHEALHLVAVGEGELLATCRLLFVGPTVQFSRLAVRASARRRGIATALLGLAAVRRPGGPIQASSGARLGPPARDPHRAAGARRGRDPRRRCPAARAPRPDLRAAAV